MISITEKTADKICQEFREMIQAIDEKLKEELKQFQEVQESFEKLDKDGLKYKIAKSLYDNITNEREEHRLKLSEEKKKYIGFIEVLMVGESA